MIFRDKNNLVNLLDFFLPEKNKKIIGVQSIEYLYISRLMVGILFFILASSLLLTIEEFARGFVDSPKRLFLSTIDVILPFAGLLLLKKTGKVKEITAVLAICFLGLVSFFSLNLGTTRMATQWFPLIIASATFIVSRRFGIICLLVSVTMFIVISYDPLDRLDLDKIKWIFENRESSHLFEIIVINSLIFAFTVVSSFAKEKMRNYIEFFKDKLLIDSQYELSKSKLLTIKNISAGVAHEINNPLAIIIGYIGMLRRDFERGELSVEKITNIETRINKSIERITGITHSLAEFGTSIFEENFEKINVLILSELVSNQVEKSLVKQGKKNLLKDVQFDLHSNLGEVEIHKDKMVIALAEILLNAIEAAESDSSLKVVVRVYTVDDNLVFEFENTHDDSDLFLKDVEIELLKQPFLSNKKDRIRLGMGLTLADNIISFHRGDISFIHDDEKTVFKVMFPSTQTDKSII